jgi:hypothetical protein
MNKFDLPAFFKREYYESHYLEQMAKGNKEMAKTWETFYFDNALSYAWVQVFEVNKKIDSKKAIVLADARKKEMEKEFK